MLIGYVRVSTNDQNLDLQKDALTELGCERFFEDCESGSKSNRQGLNSALDFARLGDTLVVWRLDRLTRSLKDLLAISQHLESKGIHLKSLQESIDTNTATGKLYFNMCGAFAQFERDVIRERTKAGLHAARARGRFGGRPKALRPDKRALVVKLYREKQHTIKEICELMGISKTTLYQYVANHNH